VVVKSTVVPGTTLSKVLPILEAAAGKRAGADFGVGMNPEFLSEGEAVHDFMFPDRIVIGGIDRRSIEVIEEIYRDFQDAPRVRTNTATAELIKYAANALLASLISYSNEIANLCSTLGGIDSIDVMHGVYSSHYFKGRDAGGLPPITAFLRAGCGFGGSCLPKDVKALIAHGKSLGAAMPLLEAVMRVNEEQPGKVVAALLKHWSDLHGVRVAVLGLSFKPGTSDVRESPAFPIMSELLEAGAMLHAHDPVAVEEAQKIFARPEVNYCADLHAALRDADAVIVVTPWREYRDVPAVLRGRSRPPVFVDARRAFEKRDISRYEGIGL
jgi:UDPglucose 6-dehydrogenase/GDP-mannose 6-dehydrogenase